MRILLLPFSLIYGLIIRLRNWFYDIGIYKQHKFSTPVISVGNIKVGGTGKTPHTEYLIRLLRNKYKVAVLSRGYGRNTKGFLYVNSDSLSAHCGDEPKQYKSVFPDIIVAVCESRVQGIEKIIAEHKPEVILLDDAFQHRSVLPGLNILLVEFFQLNRRQFLLPAGDLREPFSGRKRADVIICSKSPSGLSIEEQHRIFSALSVRNDQSVFCSSLKYADLIPTKSGERNVKFSQLSEFEIMVVSGIANPAPLHDYLRGQNVFSGITMLQYSDHYPYSSKDLRSIREKFDNIANPKKIIITTQKDWMRIEGLEWSKILDAKTLYYLPVEIEFYKGEETSFDQLILNYVKRHELH